MEPSEGRDLLIMKFLHYFITEKNYNPVVVHGVKDEIWLENMDSDIKIVRLVLGYVHNKEQLDFDSFKVKKMANQIRLKTFSLKMNVMTFYLDLNEDLTLESIKNNILIKANTEDDFKDNKYLKKYFPDLNDKLIFNEEGIRLFEKINEDILRKNLDQSEKMTDLFSTKKPIITNSLIAIMLIVFFMMYIFGNGSDNIETLYNFGALIKNGSIIRLFTSIFLHIGLIHLVMNLYALYILGKQVESFYGHIKTLIIFLYSGVIGNLLSIIIMSSKTISAGASGSIFGLMGALLYFAINQRTYMGEALKKEILPVIIINLMLGFMVPSINMAAHIGGLVAGIIISIALGVKYKSSKFERINGSIASLILLGMLIYMAYFI